MKKFCFLFLLFIGLSLKAQFRQSIFSKDPVIHLENAQKQKLYFGFFLGFNSYDFKIKYNEKAFLNPSSSNNYYVQANKSTGFNVGLITDFRIHEYFDLRFEPGLYYTKRDLIYPSSYFISTPKSSDLLREVVSTYIHFPLLLKVSSLRTGNIRPYLLGGFSTTLNLSSNAKSIDDNSAQRFRVKAWTPNYELGLGIDIFSEYFIFSPSIRGVFGINNELIPDKDPNSPWTSNIESIRSRGLFINFSFH